MKIAVSACLLGYKCRYDGKTNYNEGIYNLKKEHELVIICPECFGNLSTPRDPSEIIGDKVVSNKNKDVTVNFQNGAKISLDLLNRYNIKNAILKAKSPSCGKGLIYDGTFSSKLTKGNGITCQLFLDNNIKVYDENNYLDIFNEENKND